MVTALSKVWSANVSSVETLLHNVRYAARLLQRAPGFTFAAVVTLGLGIGANSAIFSLVKAVMLTPLPYAEAERLVMVWRTDTPGERTWLSIPEVLSYRSNARSFVSLGAYMESDVNLTGGLNPERVRAAAVTGELFQTLGVRPLVGRSITSWDTQPAAAEVAVISHRLWQRRFGAATDLVGRTVHVNGRPRTLVGVMPASFQLPLDFASRPTDLWFPQTIDARNLGQWGSRSYLTIGRLAPEANAAAATSELQVISNRWIDAGLVGDQGDGLLKRSAVPLQEFVTGGVRRPLVVLVAAVGAVLLIACANVVNLLLARADRRRREIAVRAALGAGRRELVGQLLTESVLLATAGGAAGLVFARAALRAVAAVRPAGLPRVDEAAVDAGILGFTAGLSIAIGALFGLVPALQLAHTSFAAVLNESGRGSAGAIRLSVRRGLVVAQLALTVVLVVSAGLLVRSLLAMQRVDLGFNPHGVLTAHLQLPPGDYADAARVNGFYRDLMDRLAQVPGVVAAGAVRILPLSRTIGDWSIQIDGRVMAPNENPNGDFQFVTPGYFQAMGMTLVRGRWLTPADREGTLPVVLVNDTMAARYWPGEEAIGRRFQMGGPGTTRPLMTIVGIVRNSRHNAILEEPRAELYLPHAQLPESAGTLGRAMAVVMKTRSDPLALSEALREAVRALDANLPVSDVRAMEDVTSDALAAPRFASLLLAAFAVLAMTIAAVGTYAVISLLVSERSHEIGIRMTLGAARQAILGSILREGIMLALVALAVGMAGAVVASRVLESLLFGVERLDPVTFSVVPALLLVVALVASFIPARRAASIDPVQALRHG